jgi:hypothetical protein
VSKNYESPSRSPRARWPGRRALLVCLAGLLVLLSAPGCGKKGRLPVYPVRGQVLVNNAPAKEAVVTFWPEEPGKKETFNPNARTDENGNFTLSTYTAGDGAPAGTYLVTVEWPARHDLISGHWEGDKLKGAYKDPKKSKIRVTIEKRPNELDPINLK